VKIHYKLEDAWHRHHTCEIVIYHKKFSNGLITPGLYCKSYGIWIQWLDIETADNLILDGVEVVLTLPVKKKGHPIRHWTLEELGI
jgi:hypothetical protein